MIRAGPQAEERRGVVRWSHIACPRRGRCKRFSTGSGDPSHFRTGTGARCFGVNDLLSEEFVEGESDFLWRASFDDVPVGQPEAEQVREASRARQDDVVREPYGLLAEAHGERPVRNQARFRRFALHPVQGALLPRQQKHLRPRMTGRFRQN